MAAKTGAAATTSAAIATSTTSTTITTSNTATTATTAAATPTRNAKESFLSPPRKPLSALAHNHDPAPRTPSIVERLAVHGGMASASPRTPRTRSATRSMHESDTSFSYATPDLDSMIMSETSFSHVYDYRSPSISKDDLVRGVGERPFSLFASPEPRGARPAMTPCMQSPSWPFSSPGPVARMPALDFARSPSAHAFQMGLRREAQWHRPLHGGEPHGHYQHMYYQQQQHQLHQEQHQHQQHHQHQSQHQHQHQHQQQLAGGAQGPMPYSHGGGPHMMHDPQMVGPMPLSRPMLGDAMLMPELHDMPYHAFSMGGHMHPGAAAAAAAAAQSESKRARKEKRERKTPTSTAPKRGEYRCGKCGFFPKKQKHNCATEKQKRPAVPEGKMAAGMPMDVPVMGMLPHVYFAPCA